ncbi:MFS general substrate transporter [Violaceomyces palustris]|uniref:MFS general substrate transporter n=1 Tax=Violaceomyces palustris TaxID=1673888 RepID=A0ACD0NQB5_9BASI|nr:MFS general substrate transporter [Violaceomyces palustris]
MGHETSSPSPSLSFDRGGERSVGWKRIHRWQEAYRTVFFQIVMVGFVSLTQPGIWTAINNLGAAGQAKPYLINAANALTYGIMSFGCALAGGVCNKIGVKWTLVIGVAFYTPYASSLYCNNRFGNEWYVLLGAALCGIGASMFWASEGAIAVGYPSERERGRMVATWMGIRNLGPLIGGAISLSLNTKGTKAGKVSYSTFLALIGIQCLGFPVALLLSSPEKVVRGDGSKVPNIKNGGKVDGRRTTIKDELKGIWETIKSRRMILLMPIFICGMWGVTYQSNYLAKYFTVRARALASLLTAVANLLANISIGLAMDLKWLNQAQRAKVIWTFFAIAVTGLWIWQTITEVHFHRNPTPVDWNDGARFGNAFAVYLLWKFVYEAQQGFLYWLVGTMPHREGTITRSMGVLRSFESIGSTFAYVVGATHWVNLNQCILSFSLWLTCLVPATLAVRTVPDHEVRLGEEEEEEEGGSLSDGGESDKPKF